MVTLANYRDFGRTVAINGVDIQFFVFNGDTMEQAAPKIETARGYLNAFPAQHLQAVYPVLFIPGRLPSTGDGGGTPGHAETLARHREEEIGAEAAVTLEIMAQARAGRRTFHWIPRHIYDDDGRLPYTVAHEALHGVDMNLRLNTRRQVTPDMARAMGIERGVSRPFNTTDLPATLSGQACGAGTEAIRITVNAYLSLLTGFRGVNPAIRRQIVNGLKLSQAFANVPEGWWMPYAR